MGSQCSCDGEADSDVHPQPAGKESMGSDEKINEEQINANNIVNSKIISKVPEKEVENLIDHQLEENAFLDQSTSIIIDDSNVSFPLDKKATLEIINFDEDFETDDDIKKNVIINFDEGIDDVDNNEINTTPDRNVYIDANKNNDSNILINHNFESHNDEKSLSKDLNSSIGYKPIDPAARSGPVSRSRPVLLSVEKSSEIIETSFSREESQYCEDISSKGGEKSALNSFIGGESEFLISPAVRSGPESRSAPILLSVEKSSEILETSLSREETYQNSEDMLENVNMLEEEKNPVVYASASTQSTNDEINNVINNVDINYVKFKEEPIAKEETEIIRNVHNLGGGEFPLENKETNGDEIQSQNFYEIKDNRLPMKDLGIEKRDQNFKIELHLDERKVLKRDPSTPPRFADLEKESLNHDEELLIQRNDSLQSVESADSNFSQDSNVSLEDDLLNTWNELMELRGNVKSKRRSRRKSLVIEQQLLEQRKIETLKIMSQREKRRKGGGMSLQTISDAEEYKSPPLTEWEKLMQNRADHVPFDRKSLRKSKTTTNKFDADLIEKNHEPQTWEELMKTRGNVKSKRRSMRKRNFELEDF